MTATVATIHGPKRKVEVPNLVLALETVLRRRHEGDGSWDQSLLHATDLAVSERVIPHPRERKCARQLWLRLRGADRKQPTPGDMLMWEHGHRLHVMLTDLLSQGFTLLGWDWTIVDVERELRLDDAGDVIGRLDVELRGPNGEQVILDYKTKRGRAFSYLDAAKPSNMLQVQTYARTRDADYSIVLYVDREGTNFARQFVVHRDDEGVELAMKDAKDIALLALAGTREPPVHPYDYTLRELKKGESVMLKQPWQCEWCSHLGKSCPGAVPEAVAGKVAGRLEAGVFTPRKGYEDYEAGLLKMLEADERVGETALTPTTEGKSGGSRRERRPPNSRGRGGSRNSRSLSPSFTKGADRD